MTTKKTAKMIIFILLIGTFSALVVFAAKKFKASLDFSHSKKAVTLNDNGLIFETFTSTDSPSDFLEEKKINLSEHDRIFPDADSKLFPRSNIFIQRAAKITIEVDGKKIETYALGKNIAEALEENGIILSHLDKTEPKLSQPIKNNSSIIVTRINVEEIAEKKGTNFKIITKEDSKLGWREKKVEQPGEKGEEEIRYEVTYKNGKEISRITLGKKTLKEPVSQIVVKGTYVKTGKVHTGLGTWYKQPEHLFTGSESGEGLYAANPWLPMGSYVKVTNKANGKSVIVKINDRGPFGPNRIIDLHTTAFQKIATLSAGVINVKIEEILN